MKPEKFSHEIVGTSRTFYRSQDLRVVIEGDTAKTDGNVVYIPAMDMSKDVTIEQQRITRGYVDHEAGHGRHTTMKALKPALGRKYAPHLANGMEDVRIERLIIDEYPGAQKNLEAVSEAVNNIYLKHHAEDPTIGTDFKKVGAVAITWEGRKRLGYDCPSLEKCLATLDPAVRKKVESTVDAMWSAPDTKAIVDIAMALDSELAEAPPEASPSASSGRSTGGSGGTDPSESEMYSPEVADALNNDEDDKLSVRGGGYRVWTWDKDNFWHVGDRPKSNRHKAWQDYAKTQGEGLYGRSKGSIAAHVNQMRRKLERALISKQNRGWHRNQEEGQLDSRRVVAAFGGATNVHRIREPVDDLDVSVLLVIDLSGSMSGEKLSLARKSTIAYAEALEKVGIPFAVAGFTNKYARSEVLNRANGEPGEMLYRNYPLDLYCFKKFDEPLKQARAAIGSITHEAIPLGDNADGDSLLQLYWKLLKDQKTKRRAMIVFSDGMPAAYGGNQDQRLRDVVAYIEGEGVELIGVGILSDAPRKFYKKHTVVKTLADLGKASLDQLAKLLIDPNFRVDNTELMDVAEKLRRRA